VREIRPLRLTWRELETWPWWNCDPTRQSKEPVWKPSTYRARASSRPYLRGRGDGNIVSLPHQLARVRFIRSPGIQSPTAAYEGDCTG
jgi:hypothetical protein